MTRVRRQRRTILLPLLFSLAMVACLATAAPSGATPSGRGNWVQQAPTTSPPARSGATMAFDAEIEKVVLFGGYGASGPLADTWTYDGTEWTQLSPTTSPLPRSGASMVYDPTIGDLVLFGGYSEGSVSNETWTFDGTEWTKRSPATSPPAREGGSMAYDPTIGKAVLIGGFKLGTLLNETWTYDGTEWTELSPATSPPVRYGGSMEYDPDTGDTVLFGGIGSGTILKDTWTFNGTEWTHRSPASSPSARTFATMSFDSATGNLVLFGGYGEGTSRNDTWTWDGTTWTQRSPTTKPPGRENAEMAYDPAITEIVLFGGYHGSSLNDTWTYEPVPDPPGATISSPANGAVFVVGQSVSTSFGCAAGAGGPAVKSCTDSNGSTTGTGALDTSALGAHTYSVTAVAENSETGKASINYTVIQAPAPPPPTSFPPPTVRISHRSRAADPNAVPRYTFRISDKAPGVTFRCKLDHGPFKVCRSPLVYRHLKRGRHVFLVKAVNAAGLASAVTKVTFFAGKRRT
jgi:hypothetical protein